VSGVNRAMVSKAAGNRAVPSGTVPTVARRLWRVQGVAAVAAALVVAAAVGGCAARPASQAAAGGQPGSRGQAGTAASGGFPVSQAADRTSIARAGAAPACNPYAVSLRPPPGSPQVTAGSWAAHIRARGFLIAGVDQNTYHFEYLNPASGQIEGFDVDMILAVARAIFGANLTDQQVRKDVRFVAISDAQRLPDAENGTVDIVAHTTTINCTRAESVDFSTVYYDAKQRVLVVQPADGGAAPDLGQLGATHQKVCATKGSDSVSHIESSHAILVQVPYWTDCLVLLQEGQVAGISTDDSILAGLTAQDPNTVITGPSLEDEPYGLVMSKAHPDFVRFVNAALAQDRADGQWAASYRLWVSSVGPLPSWQIGYAG
jgi:polar amino acid transport system substrate-binding protein